MLPYRQSVTAGPCPAQLAGLTAAPCGLGWLQMLQALPLGKWPTCQMCCWFNNATYLTLKVIFNSSFCGLLSTTNSDVVWVDKNADSSCTQQADMMRDALQPRLNVSAYPVGYVGSAAAKLIGCLPAPAART